MGLYTERTLKILFTRAGKSCAFPKCSMQIIDEETNIVVCEICHIKSRNTLGPRYDVRQTYTERNSYENLVVLCPIHHKIIDENFVSYSVDRLNGIKAEHEAKVAANLENPQEKLDFLRELDDRIKLIIKHEKVLEDNTNVKDASGSTALAKRLAGEKKHIQAKGQWHASHEGLQQAIDSVNAILNKVESRYEQEREVLQSLGISLHKVKGFRSILTKDFISQIKLEGFSEGHYGSIPDEFRLEVQLYLKTRNLFDSHHPYTKLLESERLFPDLSPNGEVTWSESNSIYTTSEAVVEKIFELLLKQIERGRPDDESVDEFGNPTGDEDDNYSPFENGW